MVGKWSLVDAGANGEVFPKRVVRGPAKH